MKQSLADPLPLLQAAHALGNDLNVFLYRPSWSTVQVLLKQRRTASLQLISPQPFFSHSGISLGDIESLPPGHTCLSTISTKTIKTIETIVRLLETLPEGQVHIIDLGSLGDDLDCKTRMQLWQACRRALNARGLLLARRVKSDYCLQKELEAQQFHVLPIQDRTSLYEEVVVVATK